MAISRFMQRNTTDLSQFYQWLNDNKSGTFLENLTITNSTTSKTNDTVTITDTNATLTIISRSTAGSATSQNVFIYSSSGQSKTIKTYASANATAYLNKAILNSKGLILQYYGVYSGPSDISNSYGIAITVDSNGELSCITTSDNTILSSTSNTIRTLCVYTPTSTTSAEATCRPYFNANLTCIAPITAQGVDNSLSLPYAYAALRTQLLSEGLQAVKINGDDYITNGVWYIRDGD